MEKVIVLDNEYVEVSYVAEYKLAQLIWKNFRSIPSENYREAFITILDYTENVPVVNFLSDTRLSGIVRTEDRKWFTGYALQRAEKNGLKHATIVLKKDPFKKYYLNTIVKIAMRNVSYDLKIFNVYQEAIDWLKSFDDYK